MVDRTIAYVGEVPLVNDFLNAQRYGMIGLGAALKAILGTATIFDGLACTPTGPASMQVLVAPGSVYAFGNVDGTAYGNLAADTTHQIVKQGVVLDTTTLSCPAPLTTGFSINYLIQTEFQDQDTGSTVLPYFNAANPPVAFNGPANTGISQNTNRKGACVISVKAGTAATTGTQTTPTPDAGFTGLWVVTVANGATSITSGNIALYSGSSAATGSTAFWSTPFITEKLNDKISIATGDLRYQPLGGGGGARTILSGNKTFHVASSGNDSTGDGTSGNPWQTIQHAVGVLQNNYDLAGFTATILWGGGSYTAATSIHGQLTGQVGQLSLVIDGGSGTFNVSSNAFYADLGASFTVQNMTIEGGNALVTASLGYINVGTGITFGTCTGSHVYNSPGSGIVNFSAGYTIAGGAVNHLDAVGSGSNILYQTTGTITLTGTPAFSGSFASCQGPASIDFVQIPTFSGAATGVRYTANLNGVINTNGSGATFLPGSSSGTTDGFGVYN